MREMPREGSGGSAPLRRVWCADGRSAEMALRADHAERDHERDERPGDPAGDRGDDDRAVENVHLAIHPLENFQDALRCCADRIQCCTRDTRGAGDRQQEVLRPDRGPVPLGGEQAGSSKYLAERRRLNQTGGCRSLASRGRCIDSRDEAGKIDTELDQDLLHPEVLARQETAQQVMRGNLLVIRPPRLPVRPGERPLATTVETIDRSRWMRTRHVYGARRGADTG